MPGCPVRNASLAVTSHLGPSLVLHPRFFLALASERLGLGWSFLISSTREITRQTKIPLRAENSA